MKHAISLLFFIFLTGCGTTAISQDTPLTADDNGITIDATAVDAEISHTITDSAFEGSVTPEGDLHSLLHTGLEGEDSEIQKAADQLKPNIENYFSSFLTNQSEKYFGLESEFSCDAQVMGYDDKYAYANVICTESLEGSGRADWIRFEWAGDDYEIVDFKMIGNDTPREVLFPEALLNAYDEDATETPEYALISFFDAVSTGHFEEAVDYFDFEEGHGEWVYSTSDNPAQILEDYCAATGTCLRAEVLAINEVNADEYTLTIQFFNADGSLYIFGPCCGASEEEMPSEDTFEFTVKKIDGVFKVTTAPLYRP